MLFVSYHGGKPAGKKSGKAIFNNIYAYDQSGKLLSAAVIQSRHADELSELREVALFQGSLYVANGSKDVSNILCCSGSGASYSVTNTFASAQDVESIGHPFAIVFDGDGHCYVSNQDTNVVTQLNVGMPATAAKGAAAAYLKAFDKDSTFLDGTFVASSNGSLPNVKPATPVPNNFGGLNVGILKGKVQHSVRDIVLAGAGSPQEPRLLYVADEPGNVIRMYDPATGAPCGISTMVIEPTHLLVQGSTIYVSAGNQIVSGRLCSAKGVSATDICLQLAPVAYTRPGGAAKRPAFSGMAADPGGSFYVAVRTGDQIWKFAGGDFSQPSLWLTCPRGSAPEFIVYAGADPA